MTGYIQHGGRTWEVPNADHLSVSSAGIATFTKKPARDDLAPITIAAIQLTEGVKVSIGEASLKSSPNH